MHFLRHRRRTVLALSLAAGSLGGGACLPQGMNLSSPEGVIASGNRVTSRSLLPAGKRKRFEITCDYPGSCKDKAKKSCGGRYDVEEDSTEGSAAGIAHSQTEASAEEEAQESAAAIEEAHAHDGSSPPKHRLVVKCR